MSDLKRKLKPTLMRDGVQAIRERRNFAVRTSNRAWEELGIRHSLRGYSPIDTLGFYGTEKMASEMPDDYWCQMSDHMERAHVAYIVESYNTVIGWLDGSGDWHIPPFRYSLTTTQHQWTLAAAIGVYWYDIDTTRVIMSDDVKIGRPGF